MKLQLCGVFVSIIALAACAGEGDDSSESLTGRRFISEKVVGFEPVPRTRIRWSFDGDEMRAEAGCNELSASYRLDGRLLRFNGSWGSTLMECDAELVAQDQFVWDFMSSSPSFALEGSRLELFSGANTIVLRDVEEADPDRPLVATHWVGVSYGNDASRTLTLAPGLTLATLDFADNGQVDVMTPCQHGTLDFVDDETTIRFSSVSYDGAPCDNPAQDEYSRAVIALIAGLRVSQAIDGSTLKLGFRENFLVFLAEP